MTCDFNRHRMCGFNGVDSYAQFMWKVPRSGSDVFTQYPSLVATGNTAFSLDMFKYFVVDKLLWFVIELPENLTEKN